MYFELSRDTCNNIATTICLDAFLNQLIWQGKYKYWLKSVIFLSGLVKKVWNGRWDVTPPPPFSFVYGQAFLYLCIFSHQCNASESNFKENLGISFKLTKFTPSCICKCGVIAMKISSPAIWLVRNLWMIDMLEMWININHQTSHRRNNTARKTKLDCTKILWYFHYVYDGNHFNQSNRPASCLLTYDKVVDHWLIIWCCAPFLPYKVRVVDGQLLYMEAITYRPT